MKTNVKKWFWYSSQRSLETLTKTVKLQRYTCFAWSPAQTIFLMRKFSRASNYKPFLFLFIFPPRYRHFANKLYWRIALTLCQPFRATMKMNSWNATYCFSSCSQMEFLMRLGLIKGERKVIKGLKFLSVLKGDSTFHSEFIYSNH